MVSVSYPLSNFRYGLKRLLIVSLVKKQWTPKNTSSVMVTRVTGKKLDVKSQTVQNAYKSLAMVKNFAQNIAIIVLDTFATLRVLTITRNIHSATQKTFAKNVSNGFLCKTNTDALQLKLAVRAANKSVQITCASFKLTQKKAVKNSATCCTISNALIVKLQWAQETVNLIT